MLLKKDSKIIFGTEAGFKIARLIFNYPHKIFHLRELSRETKTSTTAVAEAVEMLKSYKIIKVEDNGITKNIKSNIEREEYKHYKIIFNLYRITRYLFINNLIDLFNTPECIVLFGSFAKGEDVEGSDIDILIITSKKEIKYLNDAIKPYEKEFNRKINIHIIESLDKAENAFKNAVANGIVLYGYLKVI